MQDLLVQRECELVNRESGGEVGTGTMVIESIKIEEQVTLVDYLRGGWQLSLAIAIDFTGSNGDPLEPFSLHYLDGYNQYE